MGDRSEVVMAQIPVLTYHHVNYHSGDTVTVTPEVFAAQLKFLHEEGYQTLSADELFDFAAGTKKFAGKSVVISFDDGWLDNYLYAVPLLLKYQFKATFFIITSRVEAASVNERPVRKEVPIHDAAKKLIETGEAAQVVLGWNLIRELEESGLFGFYSHTVTHRRCADLPPFELQAELADSKQSIEKELGRTCDYLCWPYGSFSAATVAAARDAGYKALFTTIDGFCAPCSDPFMIQRLEVENSVEWLNGRLSEGKI